MTVLKSRYFRAIITMMLTLYIAGCATTSVNNQAEVPPMHSISEFKDQRFAEVADPCEGFNRSM